MAIVKMKKLRLYGVAEEQTELLRQLQLLGSVQIDACQPLDDPAGTPVFQPGGQKDVDVLTQMLEREGLLGSDFDIK